jgi:hypothetical protein
MGRKSSAKGQSQPPSSTPPPQSDRAATPWLVVAVIAVLVAGGAVAYVRSGRDQPVAAEASPAAPPQQTAAAAAPSTAEPAYAKFGPHKQDKYPPLPFSPEPAARPPDVVKATYQFAAEHPEVLSYVPCYCGCERSGHRGNDDCFVTRRAANGDVTDWEPHGMT